MPTDKWTETFRDIFGGEPPARPYYARGGLAAAAEYFRAGCHLIVDHVEHANRRSDWAEANKHHRWVADALRVQLKAEREAAVAVIQELRGRLEEAGVKVQRLEADLVREVNAHEEAGVKVQRLEADLVREVNAHVEVRREVARLRDALRYVAGYGGAGASASASTRLTVAQRVIDFGETVNEARAVVLVLNGRPV